MAARSSFSPTGPSPRRMHIRHAIFRWPRTTARSRRDAIDANSAPRSRVSRRRRSSVLQNEFRLFFDRYGVFLATDECDDRAFIPVAPIHAHGVVQVHVDGLAASLGGAFQPILHSILRDVR